MTENTTAPEPEPKPKSPAEMLSGLMEMVKDPNGPLGGTMEDLAEFERDARSSFKALWQMSASLIQKIDDTQKMIVNLDRKLDETIRRMAKGK